MRILRDDCDRELRLQDPLQRIVCLCPSLTETVVSLGLGGQLVGRTRYCVHPRPQIEAVATVGGTKNPDLDAIGRLRPDLVIAEKEENRREDVTALARAYPVYVCDIESVADALGAIGRLGVLLRREAAARQLVGRIDAAWQRLPALTRPLRVLYLIWRRPWMAAGRDTYINAVLERCGLVNLAAGLDGRYPQLDEDWLRAQDCDLCLLSSEPYPFGAKHLAEVAGLLPAARPELVDGEMFSWYGARMLPAAAYLADKLPVWQQLPSFSGTL